MLKEILDRLVKMERIMTNGKMEADDYLDSAQTMQILKIGRTQLHKYLKEGKIVAKKIEGRLFFHRSELDKLFQN